MGLLCGSFPVCCRNPSSVAVIKRVLEVAYSSVLAYAARFPAAGCVVYKAQSIFLVLEPAMVSQSSLIFASYLEINVCIFLCFLFSWQPIWVSRKSSNHNSSLYRELWCSTSPGQFSFSTEEKQDTKEPGLQQRGQPI